MNNEQIRSAVRWGLGTIGGALAGWAAARWNFDATQVVSLISGDTMVGIVMAGIGLLWGQIVKTKLGVLATAAGIAPEAKIVLPNQSDANSLPSNVLGPKDVVIVPSKL